MPLAITSIGDLLLNNKITKNSSGYPIENISLHIPNYQRPYKWQAKNALQLFEDISEALEANKEVYRVGTLILHRDTKTDRGTVYNIVDGQQRSITFALLLRAFHELFAKENIGNPKSSGTTENLPEIKLLKEDIFCNSSNLANIPNNLHAFRRRIFKNHEDRLLREQHIQKMQRLYDFVITQCELVVVITEDQTEAFQYFDSQNARGKALFPHDLLKAYHLREMTDIEPSHVEKIVANWENIAQNDLNEFFSDYIYPLKEWMAGNKAESLSSQNLQKFKGVTRKSRTPYAQFYKSAYAYANMVNTSAMPFVSGAREITPFQLNAPIIAGEPFFLFTRHYFDLLVDIRDNSRYEGFYIQDNPIVRTLDRFFKYGRGNEITRLLFDTALLLYVDRFCPPTFPSKTDVDLFEQFVVYAFVWAYSLRAQYTNLGWKSAQNYILGRIDKVNSFNIYKIIIEADSPLSLHSLLSDKLKPISEYDKVANSIKNLRDSGKADEKDPSYPDTYRHYFHFFKANEF